MDTVSDIKRAEVIHVIALPEESHFVGLTYREEIELANRTGRHLKSVLTSLSTSVFGGALYAGANNLYLHLPPEFVAGSFLVGAAAVALAFKFRYAKNEMMAHVFRTRRFRPRRAWGLFKEAATPESMPEREQFAREKNAAPIPII